jgi:hypothetical protein
VHAVHNAKELLGKFQNEFKNPKTIDNLKELRPDAYKLILSQIGKLEYLGVYALVVVNDIGDEENVMIERFLNVKSFTKFMSNMEFNNDVVNETYHSLTHYSNYLDENKMLVDIQGTPNGILTDPCWHTITSTNDIPKCSGDLGKVGIKAFNDVHTCGPVCKALGIAFDE